MQKKVCIILVNFKTWQDTVECIESILKCNYINYQIVVIENGSQDESWNNLMKWTKGELTHSVLPDNKLMRLSHPPVQKPLFCITSNIAESAGLKLGPLETTTPILFIKSEMNLGFAGGNNVGLNYAMHSDFDYAWLLNNDTVIDKNAILELVNFAETKKNLQKRFGIIGSKLMVYHKPDYMQGVGAIFNKYLGKSKIIGAQEIDKGQYDDQEIICNYVIGAAMFVSREFLQEVGVMSEDYFLYNEENDWSARAKLKGWEVGVATKSIVYHKQGASTGNSPKKSKWQTTALQYKYRGKIKLYKKYYRPQLPFLYIHLLSRSIKYLLKGNTNEAKVIYSAIFNTKFEA